MKRQWGREEEKKNTTKKQIWVCYRQQRSQRCSTQSVRVARRLLSDGSVFSLIRADWHLNPNALTWIHQRSGCVVSIEFDAAGKLAGIGERQHVVGFCPEAWTSKHTHAIHPAKFHNGTGFCVWRRAELLRPLSTTTKKVMFRILFPHGPKKPTKV